jgi:nitroreductase
LFSYFRDEGKHKERLFQKEITFVASFLTISMNKPSENFSKSKILPYYKGSVQELIRERYSCRVYQEIPVEQGLVSQVQEFAGSLATGPLGSPLRFMLTVANGNESNELKGLGTYGFIKKPAGFILGTSGEDKYNLEDFGYGMEAIILFATSLGLGTCWLGGTFKRSSFSGKIGLTNGEVLPAVTSIGYPAEKSRVHRIRKLAGSDRRLPWNALFYESESGNALRKENSGQYAEVLEMVRLAPSASNHQPWRIVKETNNFHFFLQRNKSLKPGSPLNRLLGMADLQRVDMGIAMCHFELMALELGLSGKWEEQKSNFEKDNQSLEYIVSWNGE